jgi:hypothetical protein
MMGTYDAIDESYADDLQAIITELATVLGEDVSRFAPPRGAKSGGSDSGRWTRSERLQGRVLQALRYLEAVHHVGAEVVEIGTLYNTIRDNELRARCADLLSAQGSFDRVINQATLVLEDRIRKKGNRSTSETGPTLVRNAMPQMPASGTLRLSHSDQEQQGLAHICAGLMQAFRNPTHHEVSDRFSREEALKLCAFVDNLLRINLASSVTGVSAPTQSTPLCIASLTFMGRPPWFNRCAYELPLTCTVYSSPELEFVRRV